MSEQEIIDGNRLIAEFIGCKTISNGVEFNLVQPFSEFRKIYHNDDLDFHSSWEWLMPVVEKIESIQPPLPSIIPVSVEIKNNSCRIYKGTWNEDRDGFISFVSYSGNEKQYTKIESAWLCVVEFIKWHNKNK